LLFLGLRRLLGGEHRLIETDFLPPFPLAEERVAERSDDRVSQPGGYYRQCLHHASTRPECAALPDPLFACGGKRVAAIIVIF